MEAPAAEVAKVIMISVRIGAYDSDYVSQRLLEGNHRRYRIVLLFLNAFESEPTICLGTPFLELIAEIFEVFYGDLMELIPSM